MDTKENIRKAIDIETLYKEMLQSERSEALSYREEYQGKRDLRPSQVGRREDKLIGSAGDQKRVRVARIPFSFQKKIVKTAVSFLFGSPLQKIASEKNEAFALVKESWEAARLDHLWRVFAEKVKSETCAAMVFFIKEDKEKDLSIRARVLSSENGRLYPLIDAYGHMRAFGWEFSERDDQGKEKTYLYVWNQDALNIYKKESADKSWSSEETRAHLFGKIPVVYLSQEKPEWWEVKDLIDRYEMSFSRFCDTNDYFASPMLKIKGLASSLPSKEATGKVLSLEIRETEKGNVMSSDVEYLTWDQAPESIRLEMESARSLIYALTDTPDLSLESLKGLGAVPSGFALEMLFMGALLKARWSQGDYGTAVDRAINTLKGGLSFIHPHKKEELKTLRVKIVFSGVLPRNVSEIIATLLKANAGKPLMSQKESVRINPLAEDPQKNLDELKEEEKNALKAHQKNTFQSTA